jgi:hypothetical protein
MTVRLWSNSVTLSNARFWPKTAKELTIDNIAFSIAITLCHGERVTCCRFAQAGDLVSAF